MERMREGLSIVDNLTCHILNPKHFYSTLLLWTQHVKSRRYIVSLQGMMPCKLLLWLAPHSPSVIRVVSLNTSPSFPPSTTPFSLPISFLPCQKQHCCQFVCVSTLRVSGKSPRKLVAHNRQQPLWNGICTFKMGCSNTCEVERFSNSTGTSQWI